MPAAVTRTAVTHALRAAFSAARCRAPIGPIFCRAARIRCSRVRGVGLVAMMAPFVRGDELLRLTFIYIGVYSGGRVKK